MAFGYVSDASIVNKNCFGHTHRGSMSRPTLSFLHPSGTGISMESNVIPELASGSIVVRGVLFAPHPSRPAVRQWSIFKGPRIGRVMRAASKILMKCAQSSRPHHTETFRLVGHNSSCGRDPTNAALHRIKWS